MSRHIPVTNEIKLFFHCANCLPLKPPEASPRDWSQIECGWTELGFQAWCKRCELNIIHVDFEGAQHPASMLGREPSLSKPSVDDEPDNQVQTKET